MPQLSRVSTVNNDLRVKKNSSVTITISPAVEGRTTYDLTRISGGVLTLSSFGAWNLTPNTTFSANVLIWGGGGSAQPANGGAGGFSTGVITFKQNVSYNVVVGRAGASGAGGGGSGIEYLTNSVPIIVAGGGGGGGITAGGAGGGIVAQSAPGAPAGIGTGATAYGAASPGGYRLGGPSASTFGFGAGGLGSQPTFSGGGGGFYGGSNGPFGNGGGGGSGFIDSTDLLLANTQTGANTVPPFSTYSGRGSNGNGAPSGSFGGDGLIVITVL